MPPKAKYTREEIISAALKIVQDSGMSALTARSLGSALGSSARPIFTVFESMNEVQSEVVSAVRKEYDRYIEEGMREELPFKGIGKAYIRFASEQPKFFRLLFMKEQDKVPDIKNILGLIDDNSEKILASIQNEYALNDELARKLYEHMWIYSHGIAVLIATKVCSFNADEVSAMLTEVFVSMIRKIKAEKKL